MRRLVCMMIFMAWWPCFAFPQTSGDSWETLKQLNTGQKIVVTDMNWKSTEGKFVGVSDEAIFVRKGQNVVQISRAGVLQVGKQKSRWRKVGFGALIAGVASGGFFLPIAIAAAEPAAFVATGIISAGTAGFGGAISASLPPGYRPIYFAKVRPQEARTTASEEQAASASPDSESGTQSEPQ